MPVTGLLPEVSRLVVGAAHGYAGGIPRVFQAALRIEGVTVEFLSEYASFLAKTVTLVIAILVVLASFAALRSKGRRKAAGQLQVSKLNDFYKGLRERLEQTLLDKDQLKALRKSQAKSEKKQKKKPEAKPRVFVLDFDGDIKASATESLRHEITALLTLATPKDEVVLRLESGGGMVHSYGLASSQLARIRDAGVPLTVCIDKVAASGGYMMACIGEKIISAPFAILGSIGVVAQLPNVNRLLKKHDIDFEVLTAGEYKRTLTVFGENTEKGREKFQEDLDITHQLFKNFVSRYRPQLAIDEVATGEIWLGIAALDKQLVDELKTSDEYLAERAKKSELYHLHYAERKSLQERIGMAASSSVDRVLLSWWSRLTQQRFW
jgi:serine protease SohB